MYRMRRVVWELGSSVIFEYSLSLFFMFTSYKCLKTCPFYCNLKELSFHIYIILTLYCLNCLNKSIFGATLLVLILKSLPRLSHCDMILNHLIWYRSKLGRTGEPEMTSIKLIVRCLQRPPNGVKFLFFRQISLTQASSFF